MDPGRNDNCSQTVVLRAVPSFLLKFSPSQEAGENSRTAETPCAELPLFITSGVTVFPQSSEFHNSKFCQEVISCPDPMAHFAHWGSAVWPALQETLRKEWQVEGSSKRHHQSWSTPKHSSQMGSGFLERWFKR